MFPAALAEIRRLWRQEIFSQHDWQQDTANILARGDAGGFRVSCDEIPFGAYLKPTRIYDAHNPKPANEKIVADLATDLDFDVPPVLLYRRANTPRAEETNCGVSLILFPVQHYWSLVWNLSAMEPAVREVVCATLARGSGNLALDLWIGQTDRTNSRNVIFGINPQNRAESGFVFLDHSDALNSGNRWSENGWHTIDMISLPQAFRDNLDRSLVLSACDRIAAATDDGIAEVVNRIPDSFMNPKHRTVVVTALNGRKSKLREFVKRAL
jgi:hypothetical protein